MAVARVTPPYARFDSLASEWANRKSIPAWSGVSFAYRIRALTRGTTSLDCTWYAGNGPSTGQFLTGGTLEP